MSQPILEKVPDNCNMPLVKPAQDLYQEVYERAWRRYEDPAMRHDMKIGREEIAHRTAWTAVKQCYPGNPFQDAA